MRPAHFVARLLRRFARRRAVRRTLELLLRSRALALSQRILERSECHRVLSIVRVSRNRHSASLPHAEVLNKVAQQPAGILFWRNIIEQRRRVETRETRAVATATLGEGRALPQNRAVPIQILPAARGGRISERDADVPEAVGRSVQARPTADASHVALPHPPTSTEARTLGARPDVSEPDIERLAERVIGSIDRRIAARRERLGRA